MPLLLSDEICEFAVSVHVVPEATFTFTVPVWLDVLIAPSNDEPDVRFIVRVDELSTSIFPSMA